MNTLNAEINNKMELLYNSTWYPTRDAILKSLKKQEVWNESIGLILTDCYTKMNQVSYPVLLLSAQKVNSL